ncbi:hypothetical protein [Fructilactobacillus carniphilus]|uniref:Uncharacterized protein n=1 Tax=Fructilactobacillus carniphilus TaxID=2940297 RepID=A0ABY5BWC1_9LACO|nr:hypothetical protein [Fructilactobacillus carniphilus]USS90800.1 hypothetical protein M3M37_00810 [Fructilactobacillus carniphilus]
MNILKRILLTFSSTWVFVLVYYLKKFIDGKIYYSTILKALSKLNILTFILAFDTIGTVVMLIVPIYYIYKCNHNNSDEIVGKVKSIDLIDNSFIPVYLGYFFVAMNATHFLEMLCFYFLIFIFVFFSGIEYFNPIFILFNYHMYKIQTANNVTAIFILNTRNVIRKTEDLKNISLLRINNLSYIGCKNIGDEK